MYLPCNITLNYKMGFESNKRSKRNFDCVWQQEHSITNNAFRTRQIISFQEYQLTNQSSGFDKALALIEKIMPDKTNKA